MLPSNPSIPQCQFSLISCKIGYPSNKYTQQRQNTSYYSSAASDRNNFQQIQSNHYPNDYQSFCSSRKRSSTSHRKSTIKMQQNVLCQNSHQPINDNMIYYSIINSSIDPYKVPKTKCSTVLQNSELQLTQRKKRDESRSTHQQLVVDTRNTRKNKIDNNSKISKDNKQNRISLKSSNSYKVLQKQVQSILQPVRLPKPQQKRLKTQQSDFITGIDSMGRIARYQNKNAQLQQSHQLSRQFTQQNKQIIQLNSKINRPQIQQRANYQYGRPSQKISINYRLKQNHIPYQNNIIGVNSIKQYSNQTNSDKKFMKNQNQQFEPSYEAFKFGNRKIHTQQSKKDLIGQHNYFKFHSQMFGTEKNQHNLENSKSILNNNLSSQRANKFRDKNKKKGMTVSYCQNSLNTNFDYLHSRKQWQIASKIQQKQENSNNQHQIVLKKQDTAVFTGLNEINQLQKHNNNAHYPLLNKIPGISSPQLIRNSTHSKQNDIRFGKKFKTLIAMSCKRLQESLGDEKTSSNHVSIANNSLDISLQQNSIYKSKQNLQHKTPQDAGDKIYQTIRMLTSKNLSLQPLQPYKINQQ